MICPKCGAAIPLYTKTCPCCKFNSEDGSIANTSNESISETVFVDSKLEGFKGWLALVGVGMIFGPIMQGVALYQEIQSMSTPEMQTVLQFTSYKIVTGLGFVFDVLLLAMTLYLSKLYFQKKKLFPKFYIFTTIFSISARIAFPILFFITGYLFITNDISLADFFDKDDTRMLSKSIIGSFIWIPYMYKSKRVKATFRR